MNILDRWEISKEDLANIIEENPSLRGMVFGYVAEVKFRQFIGGLPNVSFFTKFDDHDRTRKGDLYIVYRGRAFDIEAKSLQTKSVKVLEDGKFVGKAQVDGSDRREIKFSDGTILNTTLLVRGEFDILAVNCYAFGIGWKFLYCRNSDLPYSKHKSYSSEQQEQLIASLVEVRWPPEKPFYSNLTDLLEEMLAEGLGADPTDVINESKNLTVSEEKIEEI